MQPDDDIAFLCEPAVTVINRRELEQKLAGGRALRVKLGVDPTSPDIHLGHSIVLRALRRFQDRGHHAVLIIGDFTAMIGDPSGRTAARPRLTRDEVLHNAQTYREQAFKILDEARAEIRFNGEWFANMDFEKVIRLASRVTLQQMLHRDDFKKRMHNDHPIYGHEILYPVMQGWDSVMVQADVELGGTDQLFNTLIGRDFQKEEGQPQQVVLVLPILEGLDGSEKMSKSLGNYVAINESGAEMFGKLMSINDQTMQGYYSLLLDRAVPETHPLEAKKQLAFEIVQTYHSSEVAKKTLDDWNTRFSEKKLSDIDLPEFDPSQIPEFWSFTEIYGNQAFDMVWGAYSQVFQIQKSGSEIRRLMKQGSVQLDGVKIMDPRAKLNLKSGQILRLDKTHAVRIAP